MTYFTKRHYEFFATYFKTTQASTKKEIIKELALHFGIDNALFNKAKFDKACGIIKGSA
jgi:hypothetical protein